jgi:CBS domain-containing protein
MTSVAELMSRHVIAVRPETPLTQAIALMVDRKVSGLPVTGFSGEVVGMITEGDLMCRVETDTAGESHGWLSLLFKPGRVAERYVATHGRRVGEVMTRDVATVPETATLAEAAALMQRNRIKRLPVVHNGRLVGLLSRADLMKRVGAALSEPTTSAGDDTIKADVEAAMVREAWTLPRLISVAVQDGVVHLDGCLFDLRECEALSVLAENVPGVKRVENRIVCIEPNAGTVVSDPAATGC